MQSVTVSYYESSFATGQSFPNRDDLRKYIQSLYRDRADNLRVLYSAASHPAHDGKLMITLRSELPLGALPSTKQILTLEEGMSLTLRVELSLYRAGRRRRSDNKIPVVETTDIGDWARGLMTKNGFRAEAMTYSQPYWNRVKKRSEVETSFAVQSSVITMKGVVADPKLFEACLTQGIGRQKAYGFGLVEIV